MQHKIEDLERENRRLKSTIEENNAAHVAGSHRFPGSPDWLLQSQSASASQDMGPTQPPKKSPLKRSFRAVTDADESLLVEMPSFNTTSGDKSSSPLSRAPSSTGAGPSKVRQHPTARNYVFDSGSSDEIHHSGSDSKRSKYFAAKGLPRGSNLSCEVTDNHPPVAIIGDEDEDDVYGDYNDKAVLIPSSPPPRRQEVVDRSRTNPFQTTKDESVAKIAAKLSRREIETIEIGDSSVDDIQPLRSTNINTTTASLAGPSRPGVKKTSSNLYNYLNLTDKNGRPQKGLASGSKVKHRA